MRAGDLSFSFDRYPALPWMYIGLIGVVTLVSGGYPAWMLSRFRAVDVLKSALRFGGANVFTKSLVTLQFVLSSGLIIGSIVMVQQLHYMQSKDPGFAKENVVVLVGPGHTGYKKNLCPVQTGTGGLSRDLGDGKCG